MIELTGWQLGFLVAGLFMAGAFVGMFVMAMLAAAGEADRQAEEFYQSRMKEQGML